MRNAAFHCPVLHGICHDVGHLRVKGRTISDGFVQRLVNILGQTLLHDGVIETLLPKSSSMLAIRDSSSKVISLLKAFQRRGKAALLSVALLVNAFFRIYEEKGNCENE